MDVVVGVGAGQRSDRAGSQPLALVISVLTVVTLDALEISDLATATALLLLPLQSSASSPGRSRS